jgi:dTDP-4-amino-4,6-dideoxygalactose transaminase|tara:strand:+ start:336 stop:1481 length:1146 start_codon:yes stop_codon:yes gene_type:complete
MSNNDFINFCRPSLDENDFQAVMESIQSGWLTTGPNTQAFEEDFRKYIGVRNAIALNSCTAGIHCALLALGIGQGDEVITTTYTFVATAQAITWVGAKPVLIDIDLETLNILPDEIEKAITPNTKAIMPVHFAGLSCEMDRIQQIADKHNLPVIEDAAQAIGSKYKGKKIGTLSDISVFSFYATKNMTTGEGGMVTTNNDELAEKIRRFGFFGISKEIWQRYDQQKAWKYDILSQGYKYNISDILSALGLEQLKKIDQFNKVRKGYAHELIEGLKDIEEIRLPIEQNNIEGNWHLFPVLINDSTKTRDDLMGFLRNNNVGTGVHYIPIHLFSFYQKKYGYKPGDFPNAEKVFNSEVTLPLYPSLNSEQIKKIICSVRKFFC